MSGTTKTPNNLAARIERYYSSNPDEYLTYDDIVAKFGCLRSSAMAAVKSLRAAGVVESRIVVRPVKQREAA